MSPSIKLTKNVPGHILNHDNQKFWDILVLFAIYYDRLFTTSWWRRFFYCHHYSDVIMSMMASPITSLTIVYPTVYSDAIQRKNQSSASLAFVRGIHRWPVNSPHKGPVTRKMFPFDDVIMIYCCIVAIYKMKSKPTRLFYNSIHLSVRALVSFTWLTTSIVWPCTIQLLNLLNTDVNLNHPR